MTTRVRRPSAYQPRPATLPPGTHFRRPDAVPRAGAGVESENPVVTVDEPAEPPIEQPVVVAEPHDAEGPPAQLGGGPSSRARLPVLVFTAVVLVATLVAYLGWRLVGEDGLDAATTPSTPTSTPLPADSDSDSDPSPIPSPSPSATESPSVDVPPVDPPDGGSYLEVTVLESGDLEVDQWVRSSTPLTALRLSVPADPLLGDAVVASDLLATATAQRWTFRRAWGALRRHHPRRRPPGAPDLPARGGPPALAVAG